MVYKETVKDQVLGEIAKTLHQVKDLRSLPKKQLLVLIQQRQLLVVVVQSPPPQNLDFHRR